MSEEEVEDINDSDLSSYVSNLKNYVDTLFFQFNRVNLAYSNLDPQNKNKLIFSIAAFEASLSCFTDELYFDAIGKLKTELQNVLNDKNKSLEEKEKAEIQYLDKKFKRLVLLMSEAGFTPASNYTDTIIFPDSKGYEYISELKSKSKQTSKKD